MEKQKESIERKKLTVEEFVEILEEQNINLDIDSIVFEGYDIDPILYTNHLLPQNKKYKPIYFISCQFMGVMNIRHNNYMSINMSNCIGQNVTIHKATIFGQFIITNSSFKDLNINDVSIQRGLKIVSSKTKNLRINANIVKGVKLIGDTDCIIDKFSLTTTNISEISLDSYKIHELIIEGRMQSELSIKNCQINRLINSALEIKSISINSIKPFNKENSIIDLSKSTINHVMIFNSNFRYYNELIFRDIIVTKLEFGNIKWKTKIRPILFDSITENRLLKNKMSDQGNKVYETFFLAYELNAIRKSIVFKGSFGDQVTLFFNWFSNFYRLNIWLPILWFIVFGAGLFCGIICCEGLSLTDNWGKIFVFLNPTHRLNFLGVQLQNFSLFLDFTGRILLSYFIYQFIQAFRRHSIM